GAALGSLLSKECKGCYSIKEKRHKISLLGSLAHHYRLCQAYENCLNKHISIVHRRRDLEAAHTGVNTFRLKPVQEVRSQYKKEMTEIGEELLHMLQHISEIESRMSKEIEPYLIWETRSRIPFLT